MSFIPKDKLQTSSKFNFAPMIDFLFLMLAFFAILALTRATLYDTKLSLAKLKQEENTKPIKVFDQRHQINLSVSQSGEYKWLTEIQSYPMKNVQKVQKELLYQHKLGVLPEDKSQTYITLFIDKNSSWDSVAKLIFAIREVGFEAYPIYEPLE